MYLKGQKSLYSSENMVVLKNLNLSPISHHSDVAGIPKTEINTSRRKGMYLSSTALGQGDNLYTPPADTHPGRSHPLLLPILQIGLLIFGRKKKKNLFHDCVLPTKEL